jgi:hypothetical protein
MTRRRRNHGRGKIDMIDTEGDIATAAQTRTIDITDGDGLTQGREVHDATMIQERTDTGDAETTAERDIHDEDVTTQEMKSPDAIVGTVMSGHVTAGETHDEVTQATPAIGGHDTTKKTIKRRKKSVSASWQLCSPQQQSSTLIASSGS